MSCAASHGTGKVTGANALCLPHVAHGRTHVRLYRPVVPPASFLRDGVFDTPEIGELFYLMLKRAKDGSVRRTEVCGGRKLEKGGSLGRAEVCDGRKFRKDGSVRSTEV
jgi:hypothetical protein